MPERRGAHEDVAAYALGTLDAAERAAFEAHLEGCPACREELAALVPAARALGRAAPPDVPPADLRARTLAAVERAAAPAPAPVVASPRRPGGARAPVRRRPRRGAALALAGAGAAVALLALVLVLAGGGEGELEVQARLVVPGRTEAAAGDVEVTNTGIGRVVELRTDALPELDNARAFYEVWFVGPGDAPRAPNRVSAGTFHPDEQGRSEVRLAAAAVPADYPTIAITREPRDGDPRATGPEVLRTP